MSRASYPGWQGRHDTSGQIIKFTFLHLFFHAPKLGRLLRSLRMPSLETSCKLDIIIVGCGIAGLTLGYRFGKAGHRVTIVEAASALREVGAGIGLAPNVAKLLIRWGLQEKLESLWVRTQNIVIRKYDTGEQVGFPVSSDKLETVHGAAQYQIHRADLQKLLFELVYSFPNVTLRLRSRVTAVNPDPPSPYVVLQSGEIIAGDMIIGADGVRSTVRACVVGAPDTPPPRPSGQSIYRVVISADEMLEDPDLKPFIEEAESTIWMGPGKLVAGYSVRAGKEYNIFMSRPDMGMTEAWTKEGDVDEMLATYEGWDPRLRKIQALIKSVLDFRSFLFDPLKTWIHSSGLVALIGDACHPMPPWRGQGGAMAIEDAAVLGKLFAHVASKSEIPTLLKAYESIRYKRATDIQMTSLTAGSVIRGDARQQNGAISKEEDLALERSAAASMFEARAANQDAIYRHDAEQVAAEWLEQYRR